MERTKQLILAPLVALRSASASAAPRPKSVHEYCGVMEQRIVADADAVAKAHDAWVAARDDSSKSRSAGAIESARSELLSQEEEWNRLGCAGIRYGSRASH